MKTIIGTEMTHSRFGRVLILSKKERSRTIFFARQLEKGKGWDEKTQTYKGYTLKLKSGKIWSRGENRGFNRVEKVHIKNLKHQ